VAGICGGCAASNARHRLSLERVGGVGIRDKEDGILLGMAEILIEGDGKFPMDIRIPIVAAQFGTSGMATINAQGTHRGRAVGVEITVRGQMKPGIVKDDIDRDAFYKKGLVVRGIGDTTRHLADVFAEAYITGITDAPPLQQLDLTSFALVGDPILMETQHLNFKVFHDDNDERGLFFEMFLHVDIPAGWVRFDEKDEEYRVNVVKSFASLLPVRA
jgi:hypothetical protein